MATQHGYLSGADLIRGLPLLQLHVKQDSYDGGLVYQESTTSGSPMSDHSAFGVIKRNSPRATEGDMALKVSHVCTGRGNDNPVLLDTNWGSISSHIPVLPQPFAQPDGIGGANDLIFGTNSWLRR